MPISSGIPSLTAARFGRNLLHRFPLVAQVWANSKVSAQRLSLKLDYETAEMCPARSEPNDETTFAAFSAVDILGRTALGSGALAAGRRGSAALTGPVASRCRYGPRWRDGS